MTDAVAPGRGGEGAGRRGRRHRSPSRQAALLVATALAAGAAAAAGSVRRVRVTGASMEPTLSAGDHLIVVRLPVAWPLHPGDLVALRDPRVAGGRGPVLVKRVVRADGAGVEVRGDNAARSTDSRTFGPVPRTLVLGRAVYRYAPSSRAGMLR